MEKFSLGWLTPEIFAIEGLLLLLLERYVGEPVATVLLIAGTFNTVIGAILLWKRPSNNRKKEMLHDRGG